MNDLDSLRHRKRENAIVTVTRLIDFLDTHELKVWADRFREVADALKRNDDQAAISLDKWSRHGGMGSFSDIDFCGIAGESDRDAWETFHTVSTSASRAIDNLRLYLTYQIDRPLIET